MKQNNRKVKRRSMGAMNSSVARENIYVYFFCLFFCVFLVSYIISDFSPVKAHYKTFNVRCI